MSLYQNNIEHSNNLFRLHPSKQFVKTDTFLQNIIILIEQYFDRKQLNPNILSQLAELHIPENQTGGGSGWGCLPCSSIFLCLQAKGSGCVYSSWPIPKSFMVSNILSCILQSPAQGSLWNKVKFKKLVVVLWHFLFFVPSWAHWKKSNVAGDAFKKLSHLKL